MVDHNKSHKELAVESILSGNENVQESGTPDRDVLFQKTGRESRAQDLVNAYQALKNTDQKLVNQQAEKEQRAAELHIANIELAFQNGEKEKRAAELNIANKELVFQNEEKEKRAAELHLANIELAFQNEEKEKRAAELNVANKELVFQNEEKEKRAAELIKSQLQLRNFATHLQNVREEEKVAIVREIHDDLGQILVALKIDLGLFKHKFSKGNGRIDPEEIMVTFDNLSVLVDKTIQTTRRIMTGLRPEIIDSLGFIEAAKSYMLEFEVRHHLPCQFNCSIPELNTTPQQSVALFRILQEALNNIVKHAKATAVKIRVSIHGKKLILEVKDNGIGIEENQTFRQDSYGMIGMKERVTLLDGELFITGEAGKGISVRVEMPYTS
ncbi:MAG: histidine kinase [Paludibacter sp.]|nr:histidine kinase [Paludibacter sp.]